MAQTLMGRWAWRTSRWLAIARFVKDLPPPLRAMPAPGQPGTVLVVDDVESHGGVWAGHDPMLGIGFEACEPGDPEPVYRLICDYLRENYQIDVVSHDGMPKYIKINLTI